MRRRLPLISLLLAAALLAGPVIAAAHAPDHGLQPGASDSCVICVYAHGAGHGALPATPALALDGAADAPEGRAATQPLAATLRHHPIRGPPGLLA